MSERAAWWRVFALALLIGSVWSLASPPLSGPDEIEQGRRAAAVVRGQLTGDSHPGLGNLVVDVDVPETYGDVAVDRWRCFLGPLVDGAPQEPMSLPPSTCPDLPGGTESVRVQTVQYRGQPFFYAWVGLGTLVPGAAGTYLMRLLGLLPAAAFVASAAASARRSGSALAGLGLLVCLTPMVLYLAGSTNPSGLEIAAALSAWSAGMVLAAGRTASSSAATDGGPGPAGQGPGAEASGLAARFGLALVVLALLRGLGPLFAGLVLGGVGLVAGWGRVRELLRWRLLWMWGAAVVLAVALSAAWLAHIQSAWPLAERPGSGWRTALGYLPWYLRQSVGVFGTNDSALSSALSWAWVALAVTVLTLGLVRAPRRVRLVALAALAGGLAIQVTAEGLSLPPIGFFWQGRYALPLLVGSVLVATAAGRPGPGASAAAAAPGYDDPIWATDEGTAADSSGVAATSRSRRSHVAGRAAAGHGSGLALRALAGGAILFVVGVHAAALITVLRHYGARGGATLSVRDALFDPRWAGPVPGWVLLVALVGGVAALALALVGPALSASADRSPIAAATAG